ncbi:uncharacterized protein BDZ99DRAFT_431317 [Mytilinidion resinicola]|uniref:Zn(2)-C6 fungal-type domain-containing protein n=1 Tax=Mytilinidion resinicola TaxID=574789 RepID=A0A6A6Z928_9PEZI|nr:uncharacterized protein BDZ99DRAFT_431317 [Mytilinidion resinicola]KAF2817308.1 hypothetical protein BDZ99DRAFT_431317 [Mytilinidion resinicola]
MESSTRGRRRRAGTRRKTGKLQNFPLCFTCKARHTRCDEKKPVCSNCERLNLQCRASEFITRSAWCEPNVEPQVSTDVDIPAQPIEPPESTWDLFDTSLPDSTGASSVGYTVCPSPPKIMVPMHPKVPINLDSEMVQLLTAYQRGVATWMDIFDHSCTYERTISQRALDSELLLRCICAFSAKQLSLLPNGEVWTPVAARYYVQALGLFINEVDPSAPPEEALTAIMMLGSYEMIAAQGYEHRHHFLGAGMVIKTRGINASSTGMDRASFWIYIRHEIDVALTNESTLSISPRDWNVDWTKTDVQEDEIANRLMWFVGRAVDLIYGEDPQSSVRQSLLDDVQKWKDALPVSFRGVRYGNSTEEGFTRTYFAIPAAATAALWYHCLMILLYAEPLPRELLDKEMEEVQANAYEIGNIVLSDVSKSVRSFSALPLYFAGKHIQGIARKAQIWSFLNDFQTQLGFQSRSKVKKLQQLAYGP